MQRTIRLAVPTALVLAGVTAAQQDYQRRMGEPLAGLSAADLQLFEEGKTAFNAQLAVQDGLGPIFNDDSCGACHASPFPGGFGTKTVTRFGKQGPPFDPLANLGGSLLQSQAIDMLCLETVPPEADVTALRITPHTFGAGLVELIPDADLLALEANPPGGIVSGEAHDVQPLEGGPMRVGRFGWKSQVATLLTFSADAGLNEMGLTNRFLTAENAPNGDQNLLGQCDTVPDPEDGPDLAGFDKIDRFTHFQQMLAPPPQTPRSGMAGEAVFNSLACTDCHVSTFTTPVDPNPAFSNVQFKPYSDFLLHDMGPLLGDGIVQGEGDENEFRTMPLWGLSQRVDLLHDGRSSLGGDFALEVNDAILQHGGEAITHAQAYSNLGQTERDQLIAFLASLGRAEFDYEDDSDVDFFDWFFIEPDFTGPVASFGPDDPGAISDVDQDGDFDLADFEVLQRAYTGQLP